MRQQNFKILVFVAGGRVGLGVQGEDISFQEKNGIDFSFLFLIFSSLDGFDPSQLQCSGLELVEPGPRHRRQAS